MIRVLIRARSPVVKAGLTSLLRGQASLRVIEESPAEGEAGGGEAEEAAPDVIVADVEDGADRDGFDVMEEAGGGVPVILLVRGPTAEWVQTLRQGVRAVLPQRVDAAQLAAAIEAVAAGFTVLDTAEVESLIAPAKTPGSGATLLEALTAREIEVLRAMGEGLANKQIAARLGISEHTVKFHVASILGKLGAGSRTEAVTLGIRHGYVLL